ncbi:MAG TPA: cation:proton antiporter, partial [Gemmatimonadaceae bacterium]
GMLCGGYGRRVGMSPTTRLAVETFWSYTAFALNSIVFLLMGFEVRFGTLVAAKSQIGVAYVASLLGRLGVVAAVVALLRPTAERLPAKWTAVLSWGGLRGALSMVLALALPADFPHREQLVTMTFGVVLLSLLVQGLSMSWVLRRLGIVEYARRGADLDRARGELHVADAAIEELLQMERARAAPGETIADLRRRYELRREAAEQEIAALHLAQSDLRNEALVRAVRHLLLLERMQIAAAGGEGLLRAEAVKDLTADVDARIARLDAGAFADPAELVSATMPQLVDSPEPAPATSG